MGVVFVYLLLSVVRLLASGSDDLDIILWDPLTKKLVTKIQTGHSGNIFSVKVRNKIHTSLLNIFSCSFCLLLAILVCSRVLRTMRYVTMMLILLKHWPFGHAAPVE